MCWGVRWRLQGIGDEGELEQLHFPRAATHKWDFCWDLLECLVWFVRQTQVIGIGSVGVFALVSACAAARERSGQCAQRLVSAAARERSGQ